MDLPWSQIVTLASVAAGWSLNELSAGLRFKRERRAKTNDLKVELYAEWLEGKNESLRIYAEQPGGRAQPKYDSVLTERRLLLIEQDPMARMLIKAVNDSFPEYGTEEFQELQMICNSGNEWTPFVEAVDKLVQHLRRSLG